MPPVYSWELIPANITCLLSWDWSFKLNFWPCELSVLTVINYLWLTLNKRTSHPILKNSVIHRHWVHHLHSFTAHHHTIYPLGLSTNLTNASTTRVSRKADNGSPCPRALGLRWPKFYPGPPIKYHWEINRS